MGLVEGKQEEFEVGGCRARRLKPPGVPRGAPRSTALLPAGYDSMGYEMSKPDLRAELEADLKLICEGKKDKWVVLRQQVQKYKEVFIEAVAKAKK